jgi:hypothetical protein
MPSFYRKGGQLFCRLVTGPRHVGLGLVLRQGGAPAGVDCVKLPPIGDCDHGLLDPDAVPKAAEQGIFLANERFGSGFAAEKVHYRANDSPSYDMHRYCAYSIVERLVEGGGFPLPHEPREYRRSSIVRSARAPPFPRVRASAPTMPCRFGYDEVERVACAVSVTVGR